MRRAIALLITLVTLLSLLLSSCSSNRTYDEAEVKAAAETLLGQSMILNSIYYGDGIRHIKSDKQEGEHYFEADPSHLAEIGISTIAELKSLTAKTFSTEKCERMFAQVFASTGEGGAVIRYARYYQAWSDKFETEPSHIMVYKNKAYIQLFEDKLDGYHYDTITVIGVKGEVINLTVSLTVHNEKGERQDATIRFDMIEEDSGWRLHSDTYANYNEYIDSEYFR